MFALSKRTEYGVLAMSYLSGLEVGKRASVGEIAAAHAVPRELLAKILSELTKAGLAESYAGPSGGFRLAKPAAETSLMEIVRTLERRPGIVPCTGGRERCSMSHRCRIRVPMLDIESRMRKVLEETSLADLGPAGTAVRREVRDRHRLETVSAKS
jgi:Rrf2 family protein